ncbi:MAG TPA: outer membrane beta-barrel protein [Gallionellaceae bacterium]
MKKIIAAVSLLLAAFAAPASAETPFYAGLQVGDGVTVLGGYQFNKMFAGQLEYTSYGSHSGYSGCGLANCGNYASANSLGLFGVATVPLNLQGLPGLSVFGKAGLVHTTVSVWGYTFTDNSFVLGGGAQYDFTPQVSARLGLDLNSYYSDNLYIGALVRF